MCFRQGGLRATRRGLGAAIAAALVVVGSVRTTSADDIVMRLHVAWGGGTARRWQGRIELSSGKLEHLRLLGLESDESACVFLEAGNRLVVDQRSPRAYDGAEFDVTAPASATLRIQLAAADAPDHVRTEEIPLATLIHEQQTLDLDERGNRILLRRTAGDRLRVLFDRSSLVFSTGESFEFRIQPYRLRVPPSTPLRLEAAVRHGRGGETVWEQSWPLTLDSNGTSEPIGPVTYTMPAEEGVYELVVRVRRNRFRDSIVGTRPIDERVVQFVVLDDEPPQAETTDDAATWHVVESLDPGGSRWSHWLARLPSLPWMKTSFGSTPLDNGRARVRTIEGRKWIELERDGWQALPIPVEAPGQPHILEVTVPADAPAALGISIVERDAAGKVVKIGLDSGIAVPWSASIFDRHGTRRHRLIFWPKSGAPLAVFVNHHPRLAARIGEIRVLAGPWHLASAALDRPAQEERLATAYFHKPFWPATFSASQGLDAWSGRSLDDWQTFYEAGTRMVEYLKYAGYNGAVVCVATEGSALYPSRRLAATPKFDTGIYFTTGQDPRRKDVVQLLMRLFERHGLTLIPAVELSSPIPALEKELRSARRKQVVSDILLHDGARIWNLPAGSWKGSMPPYNPLSRRVQEEVEQIFTEIAQRYATFKSFGGVAWLIGGQGIGLFPGPQWGRDRKTWQRFQMSRHNEESGDDRFKPSKDSPESDDDLETEWLTWRCRELGAFHRTLQLAIARHVREARLFVVAADLFAEEDTKSQLQPQLLQPTDVRRTWLAAGLDPERYRQDDDVVLVQPRRIPPPFRPAWFVTGFVPQESKWTELFADYRRPATLLFHEPIWRALTDFDQVSPFGPEKTQLAVFSQLTPSAGSIRKAFIESLARGDQIIWFHGGWQLPLGNEEELRPLLQAWRHLPPVPFATVQPTKKTNQNSAVVARVLQRQEDAYAYVINPAPWPVTVQLLLDGAERHTPQPVGGPAHPASPLPEPAVRGDGKLEWTIKLDPYDLFAFRVASPQLKLVDWRVAPPKAVGDQLTRTMQDLRARGNALNTPAPLDVLANPDFEAATDSLPGWIAAKRDGVRIEPDRKVSYRGAQSLHLKSTGPIAWVRSDPITPPTTGRLFLLVRLRIADPKQQPPLRLAIEGRRNGQVYYRFARVGAGKEVPKLTNDWGPQPYLLAITDLPSSGWDDLRVGFDLMGPGEVWIDDVELYDLYFLKREGQELRIRIAAHESLVRRGRWLTVFRFLDGFWPRLLFSREAPPSARIARQLETATAPSSDTPDKAPAAGEETPHEESGPSILERLKPKWPKHWFPF